MGILRSFGPELVSHFTSKYIFKEQTYSFFVGTNEFLSSWYFDCNPE